MYYYLPSGFCTKKARLARNINMQKTVAES